MVRLLWAVDQDGKTLHLQGTRTGEHHEYCCSNGLVSLGEQEGNPFMTYWTITANMCAAYCVVMIVVDDTFAPNGTCGSNNRCPVGGDVCQKGTALLSSTRNRDLSTHLLGHYLSCLFVNECHSNSRKLIEHKHCPLGMKAGYENAISDHSSTHLPQP